MGFHLVGEWPIYRARLDEFFTGSHELTAAHKAGLDGTPTTILRSCRAQMFLHGGASPIWGANPGDAPFLNTALSRRRLQSVELYLRRNGRLAGLVVGPRGRVAWGSQQHRGPGRNEPTDREVGIIIEPLQVPHFNHSARTRILRGLQNVIPSIPSRSGWDSSEDRGWQFEPFRARMQGYGFAMKTYLRETYQRGGPILDPITLEGREVRDLRGESRGDTGPWRIGEREALRVWSNLTPTERWNVRSDGPFPEAAFGILRQMCVEFRKIWRRFAASGLEWPPGECEFYTTEDESTSPLG